jgi:hypothetical protein
MSKFVRARCPATGHIAALPKIALESGAIDGWEEVEGPVPDGPKAYADLTPPPKSTKEPTNG